MNVLVVEDAFLAQKSCVLSDPGIKTTFVQTIEEMSRQLSASIIDVILLDISQLDSTGMSLFSTIRTQAGEVPILILSIHDDRALALEFVKMGAQEYLVKGITNEDSLTRSLEFAIERNRLAIELRHRMERMKVLEHSFDGYMTVDSQLRITEWNLLAERTFGWQRDAILGQSLARIIPSYLRRRFLKTFKSYFSAHDRGPIKTTTDITVETRSGKRFPAELGIFRMGAEGKSSYCVYVRDITVSKKSNEELEKLIHERTEILKQSNEQLQQFAKIASHDLQEPLRAVQGFATLLAAGTEGKLDKDCTEFIEFIVDGTNRMRQLINSILSHSQINAADSLNQVTDCNSVIDEVLANLQESIEATKANLDIDSMPHVAVDRSQVVQLFQNLIGNAIKYKGASPPWITISARPVTHQWLFSVRDNGMGIEQQYVDRIFDMFSRLNSKTQYPGTGIGLAICKRIVTSHGGSIWVESHPGQGSIFMFTLPAAKEERTTTMKKTIDILLVEDTPSDVRLTEEALKRSNLMYELSIAVDGAEALEYLRRAKQSNERKLPDIILLDLNLPKMNGHEVLHEIKNDPSLISIPVVLLTVSDREEDVQEALRSKMNYYVAKPVTTEKLSTLIRAIYDLNNEESCGFPRGDEEMHMRLVLAGNPHTSLIALSKLAADPHHRVRSRVAENIRLSKDIQTKLAQDPEAEVRISLCENRNLSPSVLELLVKDESADVRLAVSASLNITVSLLKLLSEDDNVYVSASALKSLSAIER
ncbi:MAG: response regulator [Candidatus Obscuribacterales bacterium]|nr:response regulator [Candidatus Obscuribacterales bacterium]